MKIVLLCSLVMCFLLPDMYDAVMARGLGSTGSRRGDRWRRRPWEVGYHGHRNNPRRPWDRVWINRRQQEPEDFVVKKEKPRYYEDEETACTGLCLIRKLEALNDNTEKKRKTRGDKTNKRGQHVQKYENTAKPKEDKAPCTGMCALMRQRTG
eukprot:GFUD01002983.1.p1 GENE.GFUD01002983.1~~GFUD01002983.1.p1  ORF type:complete len:153 (-),score=31.01 GFUD01002983.1:96-554(-)